MAKKTKNTNIVNRKAKFSYEFLDTFVAGMVLRGTEIKSVRLGLVNMSDSYCIFKKGELFVKNLHISEYIGGNIYNHEILRVRKLLLTKKELQRLEKKVKESGLTIIPYKIFMSERGHAKIEIALARGKKTHDKRHSIKERDDKRDMDRLKKKYR
ncbi:MAG: SsrA-binding protein SmpB [Bacteroidetes bacterium]|nr:SsrA-binding protein SmpB [Bacteroidota bacterium]